MKKLLSIIAIVAALTSCVNTTNSSSENQERELLAQRAKIKLPEGCLQFDSIGLGMSFRDALIVVLTDSDFCEVREFTQSEDSVIGFEHNFYLSDGDVTGFTGKIIEYNDSVEKIELYSVSAGYDFPIHEQGTFLKVAKTYADKYGYEPAMMQSNPNSYTKRYEYTWRTGYDIVTVSFELEALHPDNGKVIYTGRTSITYLDEDLNQKRLEENRQRRAREAQQKIDENKEKIENQNI